MNFELEFISNRLAFLVLCDSLRDDATIVVSVLEPEVTNAAPVVANEDVTMEVGEEIEIVRELTWQWALAAFALLATAWALSLLWLRGMV